ncbi:hypothetical protein [Stenotrophomonas sp. GD03657]|uniref:hypothetical protein n=1 Tax=Stenotrophomonas sp. GD03657 TaxID=2975363 RepID=UPI002448510F|nr:hypothetical protein [Stenotrophomonas sp. GD03657]MDH2154163.1 hypothetical protein [Stenotrophomonas sp. GD03657]
MPCSDGIGRGPTKAEYVGAAATRLLCAHCRELMDKGELDARPDLKDWFISHLAVDIYYGENRPDTDKYDDDVKRLTILVEGLERPIRRIIGSFMHDEVVVIYDGPDGELKVRGY